MRTNLVACAGWRCDFIAFIPDSLLGYSSLLCTYSTFYWSLTTISCQACNWLCAILFLIDLANQRSRFCGRLHLSQCLSLEYIFQYLAYYRTRIDAKESHYFVAVQKAWFLLFLYLIDVEIIQKFEQILLRFPPAILQSGST